MMKLVVYKHPEGKKLSFSTKDISELQEIALNRWHVTKNIQSKRIFWVDAEFLSGELIYTTGWKKNEKIKLSLFGT